MVAVRVEVLDPSARCTGSVRAASGHSDSDVGFHVGIEVSCAIAEHRDTAAACATISLDGTRLLQAMHREIALQLAQDVEAARAASVGSPIRATVAACASIVTQQSPARVTSVVMRFIRIRSTRRQALGYSEVSGRPPSARLLSCERRAKTAQLHEPCRVSSNNLTRIRRSPGDCRP